MDEKRKVFEWLSLSTTTPLFMGPPLFPEVAVPDWEQFLKDFEDFYFVERGRSRGSVLIIERDGEEIGCLCYSCFHLAPHCAELDIWLKDVAYCGKGYGTQALSLLLDLLRNEGVSRFLIRPAERNARAIRAYEKAGFVRAPDKAEAVQRFLLPEYMELYGAGDAGFEATAVLTAE